MTRRQNFDTRNRLDHFVLGVMSNLTRTSTCAEIGHCPSGFQWKLCLASQYALCALNVFDVPRVPLVTSRAERGFDSVLHQGSCTEKETGTRRCFREATREPGRDAIRGPVRTQRPGSRVGTRQRCDSGTRQDAASGKPRGNQARTQEIEL